MRGDHWVYCNAIQVGLQHSTGLMHKSCQKTLIQ